MNLRGWLFSLFIVVAICILPVSAIQHDGILKYDTSDSGKITGTYGMNPWGHAVFFKNKAAITITGIQLYGCKYGPKGVPNTVTIEIWDKSLKQLVAWALNDALSDAGIDKSEIQAAFFGNAVQGFMEGQTCIRGQVALLPQGLHGIPVFNVENACATASSAFNLAVNHLRAGAGEVALAIGAEKMYDEDKAKMFAIFDSG